MRIRNLYSLLLLITLWSLCPEQALAQFPPTRENPKFKANPKHNWSWFNRKKYWSVGGSINAMNYFGDITPQPNFTSLDIGYTRPNFSIYMQRRIRPNITGRLQFSYGRVAGDDTVNIGPDKPRWEHNQFRYIRNLRFRNDIFELAGIGVFDLVGHNGVFYRRPNRVIPYLTAGVAVFYHNPKAVSPEEFGEEWVALQPLGTEGQGREGYGNRYSRIQIGFPLGFGLRYKISQRWDVGFEVAYRVLLTDYIDDVSRKYVDLGVFGDNDLARAMSDRSREGGRRLEGRGLTYIPPDYTYTGVDGRRYTTYVGFGNEQFIDNIRGNERDKDVLIITGIHLSYILPGQVICPEPFKKRFRRHRL